MALDLTFHVCWTRWRPQNRLRARRQPLSGLQEARDAVRPPERPLPASARICGAHRRDDGAGAFLHMHAEPVQSSRSNDDGLREQEREESGIRAERLRQGASVTLWGSQLRSSPMLFRMLLNGPTGCTCEPPWSRGSSRLCLLELGQSCE